VRAAQGVLTTDAIASSLRLQMALYFQVIYSVAFVLVTAGGIAHKHPYPRAGWQESAGVLAGLVLLEPLRLYCGYSGNLQERVPVLVAFVLATAFPIAPLVAYFHLAATGSNAPTALDKAMCTVYYMLLALQGALGSVAVAKVANAQAAQFYLHEHREAEERRRRQADNKRL
jgi:transmembrane protein 17